MSLPSLKQPFVIGLIQTSVGPVPQVSSSLVWADRLGTFKARWGIGRMHYTIEPGLYALGKPDERSPVLVTANYKMSFDKLREALPGRDMWILVLETKGINVWCASGKGTFGTMELVGRIESSGLNKIVSHRELILPQLSGPGVAAHQVKKLSGFKVIYGPIRATDLATFLDNGLKATPEMRLKTFTTLGASRTRSDGTCRGFKRWYDCHPHLLSPGTTWEVRGKLDECSRPWPFLYSGYTDSDSIRCGVSPFVAAMAARPGLFY